MTSLMIKRLLSLLALVAMTACAQPQDMLSDSLGAKTAAPAPATAPLAAPEAAPVMVEEAPSVLQRSDASVAQCSGDGIGGTGCPAR